MRRQLVATMVLVDDVVYYTSKNNNGLFAYNIVSNEHCIIGKFEACDVSAHDLFSFSFYWMGCIYFVPNNSPNAYGYEISTGELAQLPDFNEIFMNINRMDESYPKKYTYKPVGDDVCIIGNFVNPFLYVINMKDRTGKEISCMKKITNCDDKVFIERSVWDEKRVLFPSFSERICYSLDIDDDSYEILTVDKSKMTGLCSVKDKIYTIFDDGNTLGRIGEKDVAIRLTSKDSKKIEIGYVYMISSEGRLFLFPQPDSVYPICYYDEGKNRQISINGKKKNENLYPIGVYEELVVLYSETYNEFAIINDEGIFERNNIEWNPSFGIPYTPYFPSSKFTVENNVCDLNSMIDYLQYSEDI